MKKRLTPEEFVRLARGLPRDERVPYAFEKRVLAHLAAAPAPDLLGLWSHALWRAVAPCLGVMLIALAISYHAAPVETDDLDLENAIIVPGEEIDFEA